MSGRKQSADALRHPSERLAELVRSSRKKHSKSQEWLAREAGVSLSTVRKIESNDIKEPGIFTVLALWRVLGLPVSTLEEVRDASPPAGSQVPESGGGSV